MTIPNADCFELHRWFIGHSKEPVFAVKWENGECVEDDDGNFDDEEQKRTFDTLDEALAFGRELLMAKVPDDAYL
jgi:hypothetical protein